MRRPSGQRLGWIVVLLALVLAASGQAAHAAPRDDFALGQSARSGAVCKAVRDFDDPLAAKAGLRAWQIQCRGWSQTLGHLYAFYNDEAAAAAAWRKDFADRAACDPAANVADPALAKTTMAACKSKPLGAGYVVYEA